MIPYLLRELRALCGESEFVSLFSDQNENARRQRDQV
jgi:hypothetical protein